MWLTSKMPTPVRTAMCSAMMPPAEGYSTGMSQPLNSTILAPIWRWTAFSAVLRTVGVAATADKELSLADSGWAAEVWNSLPYHAVRASIKEGRSLGREGSGLWALGSGETQQLLVENSSLEPKA